MSAGEGVTELTDKSATLSCGFFGDKKKVQKSDWGEPEGSTSWHMAAGWRPIGEGGWRSQLVFLTLGGAPDRMSFPNERSS